MSFPTLSQNYVDNISNTSPTQKLEAEEAAQVLEQFVDGRSLTPSASLQATSSFVVPDFPNKYWFTTNNPRRQDEKLALIREIVDAMPELAIIRLLHEVFVTRCQGPVGNVVHTPTFMTQAELFCGCLDLTSPEAVAMALSSTVSMDTLACHLLAVRMPLYRASSVCSHSLFDHSSYSLSPFIPHHLYLAGLLHL